AGLLGGARALALAASWSILHGRPGAGLVVREAFDLLLWRSPPAPLAGDELTLIPLGVQLASLGALIAATYALCRPHRPARALPGPESRRAAMHLVRAHGHDTLAFFKLRPDKHYLFSPDGRAFLGYRVVGGVLLVSGDPVGAPDAIPALVRRTVTLAARHALSVGVVGAGEALLELWRAAGLRTLYLGDEAIVETARLSLEGRSVRKLRQSVTRLRKAGYETSLRRHEQLTEAELREPAGLGERVAARLARSLDGVFQIESLLRFNAKFATRWAPRHVAFSRWTALPRVAVAALEAEGQLPRPALPTALRRAAWL